MEELEPINTEEGIKQRDEAREYLKRKADKEMENLKTLKDLTIHCSHIGGKIDNRFSGLIVNEEALREEAIKWLKAYKKFRYNNSHNTKILMVDDWIKHFFNITEKDL